MHPRYLHLKRSQHSCDRYLLPSIVVATDVSGGTYSSIAAAYLNSKLAGHLGQTEDARFYSAGRNKPVAEFSTNSLSLFAVMDSLKSTTIWADR
jgi:hypothetical protein